MSYITVDLGTTNIKAGLFGEDLRLLSIKSGKAAYEQNAVFTEFDCDKYFNEIIGLIRECAAENPAAAKQCRSVILTGQAESLVITDGDYRPAHNCISWLDRRSADECIELSERFGADERYRITGQNCMQETFPVTKLLWLKKHKPELLNKKFRLMMIKDYIAYKLCGVLAGEYSIYNFTHFFDIRRKKYWTDILDYCGVGGVQLPELTEPCTVLGKLRPEIAAVLGVPKDVKVNCGTLDHFAGMIGTGNISPELLNESTGTVLAIAAFADGGDVGLKNKIPVHYGMFKDSYIYLPVIESGGICLEWFRDNFAKGCGFKELDALAENARRDEGLLFLPYISGTNAPDYNAAAKGVFYGMASNHGTGEFAAAVMEGVTFMMRRVIGEFKRAGLSFGGIISTGGGAKSDFWPQLKADVTGLTVSVPENGEAASLGCAIIGAVSEGGVSYAEACKKAVKIKKSYRPENTGYYSAKYARFCEINDKLFGGGI